ncbi:hypothetical protein V6N13_024911 [Hibiscus sabdariffa]|uniref:Uncharacterized protein n=2 Tax=Hibiscus sabdariffa TaxID=183260 RepID=A0ABR2A9X4_9ROSI
MHTEESRNYSNENDMDNIMIGSKHMGLQKEIESFEEQMDVEPIEAFSCRDDSTQWLSVRVLWDFWGAVSSLTYNLHRPSKYWV